MTSATFADDGRMCGLCGGPLMTGFAACSNCGAMRRADVKLDKPVVNAFRKHQFQAEAVASPRRSSTFGMSAIVAMVGVALCGGTYYAVPTLRLCATAVQSPIPTPSTMEDEFHNRDIHAARTALHLE